MEKSAGSNFELNIQEGRSGVYILLPHNCYMNEWSRYIASHFQGVEQRLCHFS